MPSLIVQFQSQSASFTLVEGANTIGRRPGNSIEIVQPSVSGKHAVIVREGDACYVEDAGSRNGTYLNRARVQERARLNHNDMLQFGDVVARFDDPRPSSAGSGAAGATTALSGRTTVSAPSGTVQLDDSAATITGQISGAESRFGVLEVRPEAKLKAVLEISRSLAGTLDLDRLLPKMLDTLFEIFKHADRGCILLKDERGEMAPRAMKHRRPGDDASVRLSRTVVNKVLSDKAGILSADAASDAAFSGSQSIADLKIRSMMCVPLLDLQGEAAGVLSIDSQNPLGQFREDDLELLLAIAGQAALSYETARLVQTYADKQKQDNELRIAQSVQRALLPEEFPQVNGYEFYASYDAAQAIGGDYYDCFDLGDGKVCLSFGDVAGKGVPGALIMSRMHSCVQSTVRHVQEVVPAVTAINDHMCDTSVEGRFVTYVFAIVDTHRHTVELANAGHLPPLIRRADGSVESFDEERSGPPIGVVEGYPYESETRRLEPGDLVVVVTDGVDEAMNPASELYGEPRMRALIQQGPPQATALGRALLADVRRHAAGRPQNDDITIMTFGRN